MEIEDITNDLAQLGSNGTPPKTAAMKRQLHTLKRISHNFKSELETFIVHFAKIGGIKSLM